MCKMRVYKNSAAIWGKVVIVCDIVEIGFGIQWGDQRWNEMGCWEMLRIVTSNLLFEMSKKALSPSRGVSGVRFENKLAANLTSTCTKSQRDHVNFSIATSNFKLSSFTSNIWICNQNIPINKNSRAVWY